MISIMTKKIEKNLEELLNLPSVQVVDIDANNDIIEAEIESHHLQPITQEDELQDDYELARRNMKELLEQGKEVLKGAHDLAQSDDQARPWEVTGNIMKHLSEMNKDLLELHEKKKTIKEPSNSKSVGGDENVTNIFYKGSPTDLIEMMKKKKNG